MKIVQIEVGESADIGCTLGGSASGIVPSGGSGVVRPIALPTAKVPATIVTEADPAEMMTALAPHMVATAILLNLHLALGTMLDGRARFASHIAEEIVVPGSIGIGAGLPFWMRLLAASETERRRAGAAGSSRNLPIDAIEQITAATDGHAIAIRAWAPSR